MSRAALERFAGRARRAAGIAGRVDVLIASSAVLRDLNRRFRRKDRPTDVLSFPAEKRRPGRNGLAGEIAIAGDIAAGNAARGGHAVAEELKILLLHGLLHLAGHDHESDQGQMARWEQRLRAQLGLHDSLIARAGNAGGSAGRKQQPAAAPARRRR